MTIFLSLAHTSADFRLKRPLTLRLLAQLKLMCRNESCCTLFMYCEQAINTICHRQQQNVDKGRTYSLSKCKVFPSDILFSCSNVSSRFKHPDKFASTNAYVVAIKSLLKYNCMPLSKQASQQNSLHNFAMLATICTNTQSTNRR